MKILVVHPDMTLLGGGERLCCETMRALMSFGHELTLVSESFDPSDLERFFGYEGLFARLKICSYLPSGGNIGRVGTTSHLLHQIPRQNRAIKELTRVQDRPFDLIFSTQEVGYIPDLRLPVIQWGYFPAIFPGLSKAHSIGQFGRAVRWLPLRAYINRKISRISLVLAISNYSKRNLDANWERPSALVYPSCNMVQPKIKRDIVVTAARAVPIKRLELFWKVAELLPQYEFVMLLTQDPKSIEYSISLSRNAPSNGRTIFNPSKQAYHRFLGEAKVYLHLMQREHFGITVVEAMSASCVPIVHDSGGPKEIVDGNVGFRWHTVEDIPNMIDQAMKKSPSEAARLRAQDFSVDKFDARLHSIFSRLES